jgi:hypothetical protein
MWAAEVHPCNEECLAGCTGPKATDCHACVNYKDPDGVCVFECRPGTYAEEVDGNFYCRPCNITSCLACTSHSTYALWFFF